MEPCETISAITVLKYAFIWKQFGLSFLITQLTYLGIQDLDIRVLLLSHPGDEQELHTCAGVGSAPRIKFTVAAHHPWPFHRMGSHMDMSFESSASVSLFS